MKDSRSKTVCAFAALIVLLAIPIQGQVITPGVTDTSIQIGSCSALAGTASFLGMQTQIGALAYFHMVNVEGGIYGRKIELQMFDDGYDSENAAACFEKLKKEGF